MSEKTFTESELREVLVMMTTPCENEIAMTRKISGGKRNDVSNSEPVFFAEAGAKAFVDQLISGQRGAEELRWGLIYKSCGASLSRIVSSLPNRGPWGMNL